MNSQASDKHKTLTQPLLCVVHKPNLCTYLKMNFKLVAILTTVTIVFSLNGLVINAENSIHISGEFKGEGIVNGSAFKGNKKQKALAAVTLLKGMIYR